MKQNSLLRLAVVVTMTCGVLAPTPSFALTGCEQYLRACLRDAPSETRENCYHYFQSCQRQGLYNEDDPSAPRYAPCSFWKMRLGDYINCKLRGPKYPY